MTFDAGGISGHPNHTALAHAIMAHLPTPSTGRHAIPKVWLLATTSLLRKYLGVLEVLVSLLLAALARLWGGGGGGRPETRVALNPRPWVAYSAMLAHASQFVWYRRLSILFSRYTYVNTMVAASEHHPQTAAAAGAKQGKEKRKAK